MKRISALRFTCLMLLSCAPAVGRPGVDDSRTPTQPPTAVADTVEPRRPDGGVATALTSDAGEADDASQTPDAPARDSGTASDGQPPQIESPSTRTPPADARPAAPPSPIRVALYRAPGVSLEAHYATLEVLREARGFLPSVVTPEEVRAGALENTHVVIFTGGRGSVQGRSLEETGRQIVRDFVATGGGYIGVCAGAYLAMQGTEEFYKLAIVAARNLTGDAWRRGEHTLEIREVGGEATHRLFYANGPVFEPVNHQVLPPYHPLALYISDAYLPAHGTFSGEMPGTPAILASQYGNGRIILFSPNPVLAAEGETASPEMMLAAIRWVATRGAIGEALQFNDVFR